eukprot:TRINITY_DN6945_c0_g1_i8.p1 TRINITY_DN6945_c0_g1~~TRINITY_DN6945_c0_g1_i8.p1  ORF type:complete len:139 (-),score=24.92 TRINITY_DN6945_c0_g1_i8:51-467(-)
MAALRANVTGTGSATLSQAKHRALYFFRAVSRELPEIMNRYNLHEVVTLGELRSRVAAEFRKHPRVINPKVVDMLVYKGSEELSNVMIQAKQRHHILSQYVVGPQGVAETKAAALGKVAPGQGGQSEFLKMFYESNNL